VISKTVLVKIYNDNTINPKPDNLLYKLANSSGFQINNNEYINKPIITFAKTSKISDYKALDDSEINIVFLIALPKIAQASHLDLLSELARLLMNPDFRHDIKNAEQADEILDILSV